jgi:hypothetical protein
MSRLLLACLLAAIPSYCQTITASLEGDVKDTSGAAVPGARVQVINADAGVVTRLESGPDGRFIAVRCSRVRTP